jgi:hypothetical protein
MPLGKRKEAEMKPTPRSARMGAIADALMAARDWADKAQVPEVVPLLGGQGLGSLMLGKAPEELNEMSYGNMPLRINPYAGQTASFVPEMKAGRKEQVADLATLVSVPKVGKAGVGLAGVGDVGSGAERARIGYHGTPHRFAPEPDAPLGRFKSEKIGSGEGAQAYGYGLYFAESPKVAKGYKNALSYSITKINGVPKEGNAYYGDSLVLGAGEIPEKTLTGKEAYEFLRKHIGTPENIEDEYALKWLNKYEKEGASIEIPGREDAGSFYTVDIPDEKIEKMLDWDISIGEQPEAVQNIFNKLAEKDRAKYGEGGGLDYYMSDPDSFSGETIYKYLEEQLGGQKEVSAFLQKEGIPGVKYFDQFSRDELEGTRNIVVFPGEEKNIKILKRNEEEAPKFAKGGMMKPTIEGFQDGGTAVEPTTGNDVPVGSLPNEVADDIDAKLSEGEFVLPADVVRYIGLERLMKLRDDAKKGLQRMAQIGQMGNAEEVVTMSNSTFEGEDEEDTDQFESDIDEILSEDNGVEGQTERMMAAGGLATMPYATGTDLSKAPKNPVFDVRYLKHDDGRVMYITYINGKPLTPVPEGFRETTQEDALKMASTADEAKKAAEKKTETPQTREQEIAEMGGGEGAQSPTSSIDVGSLSQGDISSLASGTTVSPGAIQAAGVVGAVLGLPTLGLAMPSTAGKVAGFATNMSGQLAGQQNIAAVGKAFGIDTSTPEGQNLASSALQQMSENDITGVVGGSQNAAMSAGISAATQAANIGLSPSAQAVASQSAVNAVVSGTDPETAINDAVVDAASADASASGGGGGMGPSVGDSVSGVDVGGGVGVYAKGGLINKRKSKAKRGKGIVAQK